MECKQMMDKQSINQAIISQLLKQYKKKENGVFHDDTLNSEKRN